MVPESIQREILIEAPVAKVWAAVTTPEHIGTWFGNAGATVDLRPGGAMTCTWRNGEREDTVHAVVEKVDVPNLFAYRWARLPGLEPTPGNSTLVEFTLRPEGDNTRLKVVESGFPELEVSDEQRLHKVTDNTEGWRLELAELRDYVAALA